jgi:hypothetical protein
MGCPYNMMWFCSKDGTFYFCDSMSDTWLHVGAPVSLVGEQNKPCNFGDNPTNDEGCSVAWGAGVGTDTNTPRTGLFAYTNFTVISWGLSMDDQSECTSGFYNVMICWTTGPLEDSDFVIGNCQYLAMNQTGDAAHALNLRFEIPGYRYIIWGVENFCNGGGSVTDWNVHLLIKYRMDNP